MTGWAGIRWASLTAALAVLAGAAGCGGDDGGATTGAATAPQPAPRPAATPQQFADRFARLTGVRLQVMAGDTFGTRFDTPREPDRYARYGIYSLTWTRDDHTRSVLLGGSAADPRGIHWERVDDDWSLAESIGPRLVLEAPGDRTRVPPRRFERVERAVRAAYTGRTDVLPPAERPCRDQRLDPLRGRPGSCAVGGMPVTFVDGDATLRTPAVEATVRGVTTAASVGRGSPSPAASGRYVVVAYRVRNPGPRPLPYLRVALRLGGRTIEEDPGAGVLLPRSGRFPLAPGASMDLQAAFEVEPALAARARREGALVLPGALDDRLHTPAPDLAQGWIRLARAPAKLPPSPRPAPAPGPQSRPQPPGPPAIPFHRGSGREIGFAARSAYTAGSFFPIPRNFVRGGIPVGSRAGDCRVPAPTARDKAQMLAFARRADPRDRVTGIFERNILIADCGSMGRWGILFWVHVTPKDKRIISGTEIRVRGGRWVENRGRQNPGCGIPLEAAAVWQIDVSHCPKNARRPAPDDAVTA